MRQNLIVKKPDEIVKMRCKFSESALKLSAYVISILKENKYVYEINIRDYLKKFDKSLGDFEKLYLTAKEIATKSIEFIDREKKEFVIYTIFYSPKYKNGILQVKIDEEFHSYLMKIKDKYLKYNIKNIMFLTSKYSIRLYELLKNEFEMLNRQNRELVLEISIEELRELLNIPSSYKWQHIKTQILEKSKKDFEKIDINFEYEVVKQGRKITNIKFMIYSKEQSFIDVLNTTVNNKKMIKNNNLLVLKKKLENNQINFQTFVKELQKLKNVEITNVLPGYLGKKLKINEFGFLELDGEELDNVKANSIRRILYKHPDLLGEFKEIDEGFMALREKFIGKVLVFKFDNLYYAIGVKDLTKIEDKIKVTGKEILRNIENFEVKFDLEWLKKQSPREKLNSIDVDDYIRHNNTIELQRLEEFFENNKDKFSEWLQELEKESFELSERIIKLDEESEEYKENAKKLELLDKLYMKGYELLEGERISDLDKKMILSAFKKWIINNIE